MADAEARREARRQKILQNSEKRMNKLLGNVSEQHGIVNAVSGTDSKETISLTFEKTDRSSNASSSASGSLNDGSFQSAKTGASSVRQRVQQSSSTESQQRSPSSHSLPDPLTSASHFGNDGSKTGQGDMISSFTAPPDPIKVFDLMRCGGCLLAAFITRWALNFGLGILFLELALVPFILLEAAFYMFHQTHMKDIQLPHKNTMITYVLVLSGMKPDVITKYNVVMGYFTAFAEDFAVYLFSFFIFNAVM